MLEQEFIPYEQALALKELGFDEPCFCIYNREKVLRFNNLNNPNDRNRGVKLTANNGRYPAPLYQQAFRWFESKGYRNYVASNQFGGKVNYWFAITPPEELTYSDVEGRNTKEEAELECLKKLIEIVKKTQG